jgi:hypothetical protein
MNQIPARSCAVALALATVVSSGAAAGHDPNAQFPADRPSLTAPTVDSPRQSLNSAEQAKYQRMTDQSRRLAQHEAAGGKGKTVVIVVAGAVVVVVAAVAVRAAALGSLAGSAGG